MQRYGESISFDWRLYPYDILGSMAQAEALARARIITRAEMLAIHKGLKEIVGKSNPENLCGRWRWRMCT